METRRSIVDISFDLILPAKFDSKDREAITHTGVRTESVRSQKAEQKHANESNVLETTKEN